MSRQCARAHFVNAPSPIQSILPERPMPTDRKADWDEIPQQALSRTERTKETNT
jgi:hypothetical protein